MKTRLVSSLALFALCSALNLSAAEFAAGEMTVASVPATIQANGDTVAPGATRIAVSLRLGKPGAVLPDGSWVYRGYTGRFGEAATVNGSLIVRFQDGKVSTLSLADRLTVVALSRRPASPTDRQLVAAAR